MTKPISEGYAESLPVSGAKQPKRLEPMDEFDLSHLLPVEFASADELLVTIRLRRGRR
jgi:hypothetical protein